jgi:hypothetical protein
MARNIDNVADVQQTSSGAPALSNYAQQLMKADHDAKSAPPHAVPAGGNFYGPLLQFPDNQPALGAGCEVHQPQSIAGNATRLELEFETAANSADPKNVQKFLGDMSHSLGETKGPAEASALINQIDAQLPLDLWISGGLGPPAEGTGDKSFNLQFIKYDVNNKKTEEVADPMHYTFPRD